MLFFSKCWNFRKYGQKKKDFFEVISKNIIFLGVLIILEILVKKRFSNWAQNIVPLKCWHFWIYGQKKEILRKSSFSNIEIFGNIGKKRYFQSDLKIISVWSKLSENKAINGFFILITKNHPFMSKETTFS